MTIGRGFSSLQRQIQMPAVWDGRVYNVGGGAEITVSLLELTELCEAATGTRLNIASVSRTSGVDVRIYLTDIRKASQDFNWRPVRRPEQIIRNILGWIDTHRDWVEMILD